MRVVVTASREWDDVALLNKTLDEVHARYVITALFHGEARGGDLLAKQWAVERGIPAWGNPYAAAYGKSGGPIRNGWLLDEAMLDVSSGVLVVAFPLKDSRGTWDCVRKAKERGLNIRIVRDHLDQVEMP